MSNDEEILSKLLDRFKEHAEGVADSVEEKKREAQSQGPVHVEPRLRKDGPEFFTEEDFARLNNVPIPTARPVPREGVVSIYDYGEYVTAEMEKGYAEEIKNLFNRGKLSAEERDAIHEKLENPDKKTVATVKRLVEESQEMLRDRNEPRPEGMTQVESLMYDWHMPGALSFHTGEGGLPVAHLSHPNGEQLTIHLQGTHE